MSYYKLISTPAAPIVLADAKHFLRVDSDADDDLITALIESAVDYAEKFMNVDLRSKTWEGYYLQPSYSKYETCLYLPVEKAPVQSITSVEVSINNVFSSFTNYIHRESSGFDRLLLSQAVVLDRNAPYTFKVTFVSGFLTLPKLLETAILEHVSFLYENRGDVPSELPNQVTNIYQRYRNIAGYA